MESANAPARPQWQTWLVAVTLALSFAIPFAVFTLTMAPGLTFGDSGEFLALSKVLGIAHPPGFPLYLLLAHGLGSIPWWSYAYGVNMLSALSGALTSLVLAIGIWTLTKRWWLSLLLPLVYVFFPLYWEQATMAEVYTLNSFFVALTFTLLILGDATKQRRWFYLAALSFGIGGTNHPLLYLFGPAILICLVVSRAFPRRDWRAWASTALLALVGATLYLYLPIRSAANPDIAWGPTKTLSQIARHIGRSDYASAQLDTGGVIKPFGVLDGLAFGNDFLLEMVEMFGYGLLGFVLLGLVVLWRRKTALAALLFFGVTLSVAALIVFSMNLYSQDWSGQYRILYLQSLLPLVYLAAYGIHAAVRRLDALFGIRHSRSVFAAIGLLLLTFSVGVQASAVWPVQNRSNDRVLEQYLRTVLSSLEPNALLVIRNSSQLSDSLILGMLWTHGIERIRPDVAVISDTFYLKNESYLGGYDRAKIRGSVEEADRDFLSAVFASAGNRPIYSFDTFAHAGKFYARSNGIIYRLFPTKEAAAAYVLPPSPLPYTALFPHIPKGELRKPEAQLITAYYYSRAFYYFQQKEYVRSGRPLELAIAYDPEPQGVSFYKFVSARKLLFDELNPQ